LLSAFGNEAFTLTKVQPSGQPFGYVEPMANSIQLRKNAKTGKLPSFRMTRMLAKTLTLTCPTVNMGIEVG